MAWIESHQALSRHRKTLRATAQLRVDRHKLIGHLHELWWWALDNADLEGNLGDLSEIEIASGAGWPEKDAVRFVETLVTVRFMERHGATYVLHDWYAYAGKLMAARAANRERMSRARAPHVQRTVQKSVALPYPTQPNQPNQPNREDDICVREFRDTALSKLPPRFANDALQFEEQEQLAREYAPEPEAMRMLGEAIASCRKANELPFASNLRKHLPAIEEPDEEDIFTKGLREAGRL